MILTFSFDVEKIGADEEYTTVYFKEELSEEQAERLEKSYRTGRYYSFDEDESIEDIFNMVYDIAMQLEEQEEDYEETSVQLTNFRYPEELR